MTTYYDRFKGNEATKDWNKVEFISGRCLQSAELNEIQSILNYKLSQVGEAIWNEGDVVAGHAFTVGTYPSGSGTYTGVEVKEGLMFIEGAVRIVSGTPSGSPVPVSGSGLEYVGVKPTLLYITENEDDDLRDPAEGFDNYNSRGAHRSKYSYAWASCNGTGSDGYIPVVYLVDGYIKNVQTPTIYSDILKVIERRTHDESGNYTVNEFPLHLNWTPDDEYESIRLTIDEGKAYVEGAEIKTGGPRIIDFSVNSNYASVSVESLDEYDDDSRRLYELDQDYVRNVSQLSAQVTGVVAITKSGAVYDDILTQAQSQVSSDISSLVNIIAVATGSLTDYNFTTGTWVGSVTTNYLETISWLESGDEIDWSPSGPQPAVGETYYVACYFDEVLTPGVRILTEHTETIAKHDYLNPPQNLTVVPSTSAAPSGSYYMYKVTAITDYGETTPISETTLLGPVQPSATEYIEVNWDAPSNVGLTNVPTITGYRIYRNYPNTRILGLVAEVEDSVTFYTDDGTDGINFNYLPPTRNTTNRDELTYGDLHQVTSLTSGTTTYTAGTDFIVIKGNNPGVIDVPGTQYHLEIGVGIIDWITTNKPTAGTDFSVTYEYWDHSSSAAASEGDYVCAQSYREESTDVTNATYQVIGGVGTISAYVKSPFYLNRSNNTIERLTDFIDFRTTGTHPRDGDYPRATYTYYLGRIDHVFLRSSGLFGVADGVAAKYPTKPATPLRTLPVCYLAFPPYVYEPKEITLIKIPSKRYTMLDIRKLEERIATLEYYQSIYQLDREAIDQDVESVNPRRGIFTDLFIGHAKSDVFHQDYSCCIDDLNKTLKLPFTMTHTDLWKDGYLNLGSSTVVKNDRSITLPFDEFVWQQQPFATGYGNVNPFDEFSWRGYLRCSPESDTWVDTETLPDLYVDFEGENQNYQSVHWEQTTWGEWRLVSTGLPYNPSDTQTQNSNTLTLFNQEWFNPGNTYTTPGGNWYRNTYERTGEQVALDITPTRITKSIGERVVDVSKATYIRANTLTLTGDSLKPDEELNIYFDGTLMTGYDATVGTISSGKITTDSAGEFSCKIDVPGGTYRTGIKVVKVESSDGSQDSWAETRYTAEGLIQTKQESFLTVINNDVRFSNTTLNDYQQEIYHVPDRHRRYNSTDSLYNYNTFDPLAQTFYTADEIVFISSIDLYFKSKSSSIPINVEIRSGTNRGFPGHIILGRATVQAADVNVSEYGNIATNFTFNDPVALSPDQEYSFIIWTKSTDYEVWYGEVGQRDVLTDEMVTAQPHVGVYFESANNVTWSDNQWRDIKFTMYRCTFQNTKQLVFNEVDFSANQAFLFALNVTQALPEGAYVQWSYSTDSGTTWYPFEPLIDSSLSTLFTKIVLKADFFGVRTNVSPLLNSERFGLITVLYESSGSYITKSQEFNDGCNELHIYLDIKTNGQTLTTLVEFNNSGDFLELHSASSTVTTNYDTEWTEYYWNRPIESFETRPSYDSDYRGTFCYEESTGKTYYGNAGTGDWEELDYVVNGEYESIRVRIDMSTTNQAITPEAKRLRVICNGP